MLKLISGLVPASGGVIRVNGQRISGPTASIGIVFMGLLMGPLYAAAGYGRAALLH